MSPVASSPSASWSPTSPWSRWKLTSLTDDIYGDITQVQGQITSTTCVVPTAIDVNGIYECSFTGTFEGNGGDTQTDIVSGVAQDDEANAVDASDDAFVELLPVPPVISATKTPNPTEVVAPGGDVTFTITITNESTFEPVTIDGLEDSVYGDLNGRGTCLADGSITLQPGQTYTCRFTAEVTGSAGSTHRNTIIATASDDDPEPAVVTAAAPAEVAILAAPLLVQPETNMLIATDTSDPLESGFAARGAGACLRALPGGFHPGGWSGYRGRATRPCLAGPCRSSNGRQLP